MAESCGGTIMSETSCEWVRDWLPLLSHASDDLSAEQTELVIEERERIAHHLDGCPACRSRQVALEQVAQILSIAASRPPVMMDTPSVWPVLEQRMQQQHRERSHSRWLLTCGMVCRWISRFMRGPRRGYYSHLGSASP